MKTAVLAGTTGLIGSQVLTLLLNDTYYSKVIALSRKPLTITHPKLDNLIVNFDSLTSVSDRLRGDDVFCCLGTTMKVAGSKEAFREVDFEYPLSVATITKSQGATQFLLITALGADANSAVFYNRVKGEVETAIAKVGFSSFHIFQPSMLLGPRTESRAGESIGKMVMKALDFVIPKKYKAIESEKVARAMLVLAKKNTSGKFIHMSGELQDY